MRILLHICCAPCAVYTFNILKEKGNAVEGFFYNPNIHPSSEYMKRKESAQGLSESLGLKIRIFRDCRFEDFFRKVNFHEEEGRCPLCWSLRLNKAAEYAAKNGFDGFSTTLLISPYQDHDKIRQIGEAAAERYAVEFVYEDFRKGFRESHTISRKMGLYHQNYCGCLYSERERFLKSS
ncbi:MAG: epoxyqueuosine reductase QueH [Candidatus Omnitrophica bacterium]|nr:epoxyqueuosine reductase QueH [Candidatus Omnitrophota bacterium]